MAPGFSREELPLVVIVGPTASGKTSLAIKLAEEFGGEIVCADSRTIYRGMDIGTAKPTPDEQARVPHWGLDLVEPGERFTVADFKSYACEKIGEIRGRGHVPFLVGGTGLYIDAVIFDYQFRGGADQKIRGELNNLSLSELYKYCYKNNVNLPENKKNRRHVIRAIERKDTEVKRRTVPTEPVVIVGITTDRDILRNRIASRTEQLFQNSVVEEATKLGKKYGWDNEAMTGNVYRLAKHYLEGEFDLEEFKDKVTTSDRQLAKRQLTWLKRNPYIKWLELQEAEGYLSALLAKYK